MNRISKHLNFNEKVNYGSFYTPKKYVDLVSQWMQENDIDKSYTIFDPSCGYGAFFELHNIFNKNKYIGNDIDSVAIHKTNEYFPFVKTYNKNLFNNTNRVDFEIGKNEKLIIVGNPPYNDITSQIHSDIKKTIIPMDGDIKTRDYGMSSLLVYDKLGAYYVIVLHPLSYLIKKTNFNSCIDFFKNYELINHIIFNSQEFDSTSKKMGFPIIVAMYRRCKDDGKSDLSYNDILNIRFKTIEGKSFALSDRDYICKNINKYPGNVRYKPEILFYTLRDINALKRSRTFIKERENNAVDVDPKKLKYYCYLDCFKAFADTPYYMGNFDVPFIEKDFDSVAKEVMNVSMYMHSDIFGERKKPQDEEFTKVRNYIDKCIKY